jgi:hypothetical protein
VAKAPKGNYSKKKRLKTRIISTKKLALMFLARNSNLRIRVKEVIF